MGKGYLEIKIELLHSIKYNSYLIQLLCYVCYSVANIQFAP